MLAVSEARRSLDRSAKPGFPYTCLVRLSEARCDDEKEARRNITVFSERHANTRNCTGREPGNEAIYTLQYSGCCINFANHL